MLGKIYTPEKEIVVIGATKKKPKKLPKKVPAIKVRVSRGKSYDPNIKTMGPDDTVKLFRQYLNNYHIEGQEQFLVMYLTRSHSVIGIYPHSKGGMTATVADVKMIVATALSLAAEAVITCHNHPSGNLKASDGDLSVKRKLERALDYHGIRLLDNVILTKNSNSSY